MEFAIQFKNLFRKGSANPILNKLYTQIFNILAFRECNAKRFFYQFWLDKNAPPRFTNWLIRSNNCQDFFSSSESKMRSKESCSGSSKRSCNTSIDVLRHRSTAWNYEWIFFLDGLCRLAKELWRYIDYIRTTFIVYEF